MDDATVRAYLPGRREAAVFSGLSLLGLFVWALRVPPVAEALLGERLGGAVYSLPIFFLYFGLPVCAVLASLAGLLLPRGFWLWGAALYLLTPVADAASTWRIEAQGVSILGNGPAAVLGYATTLVFMAIGLAIMATVFSALGAALRILPRAVGALRRLRAGASP